MAIRLVLGWDLLLSLSTAGIGSDFGLSSGFTALCPCSFWLQSPEYSLYPLQPQCHLPHLLPCLLPCVLLPTPSYGCPPHTPVKVVL